MDIELLAVYRLFEGVDLLVVLASPRRGSVAIQDPAGRGKNKREVMNRQAVSKLRVHEGLEDEVIKRDYEEEQAAPPARGEYETWAQGYKGKRPLFRDSLEGARKKAQSG